MAIRITIQVQLIDEGFSVQDCAVNLLQMEVPVCRLFIRVFIRLFISLLVSLFSTISFFLIGLAWFVYLSVVLFILHARLCSFTRSLQPYFFHSLISLVYLLIFLVCITNNAVLVDKN